MRLLTTVGRQLLPKLLWVYQISLLLTSGECQLGQNTGKVEVDLPQYLELWEAGKSKPAPIVPTRRLQEDYIIESQSIEIAIVEMLSPENFQEDPFSVALMQVEFVVQVLNLEYPQFATVPLFSSEYALLTKEIKCMTCFNSEDSPQRRLEQTAPVLTVCLH